MPRPCQLATTKGTAAAAAHLELVVAPAPLPVPKVVAPLVAVQAAALKVVPPAGRWHGHVQRGEQQLDCMQVAASHCSGGTSRRTSRRQQPSDRPEGLAACSLHASTCAGFLFSFLLTIWPAPRPAPRAGSHSAPAAGLRQGRLNSAGYWRQKCVQLARTSMQQQGLIRYRVPAASALSIQPALSAGGMPAHPCCHRRRCHRRRRPNRVLLGRAKAAARSCPCCGCSSPPPWSPTGPPPRKSAGS